MATTVYRSTDASAPTLNGTAGSLIAVLDACLVNGYGSKAAAGWAKSFSGTNKAVYRAPSGTRFYLRVLDDGSDGTNGAKVATIRGYESMTDVDTGTEAFPTTGQMASGLWVGKSTVADSSSRPWMILADSKRVMAMTAPASGADGYTHFIFGDLVGASAADAYAAMIYACTTTSNAVSTNPGTSLAAGNLVYGCVNVVGLYAPRALSGTGSAVVQTNGFFVNSPSGGSALPSGPDASGNVWAEHVQIIDDSVNSSVKAPRGYVPWLRYLRNNLVAGTHPSYTAFGSKLLVRNGASSANAYLVETADQD